MSKVPTFRGRDRKLTSQIGEFLVCAEVGRRLKLIATPFAGNVPGFDLVVVDDHGRSLPIQVKTFQYATDDHPCWPMDRFVAISIDEETKIQTPSAPTMGHLSTMVHVFVLLGQGASSNHPDRFFICSGRQAQLACLRDFRAFLKRNKGRRPRNPDARQVRLKPSQISGYENNWALIITKLSRPRA